jgi:hypothetical protein
MLNHIREAEAQIQKAAVDIQSRRASLQPGDPELAKLTALQAALGAGGGGGGRGAGRGGGRGAAAGGAAVAPGIGTAESGGAPPAPAGRAGRGAAGSGPTPLLGEFTSLYTYVIGSEDRPTGGAIDRYQSLRKSLDDVLAKLKTVP